MQFGLFGPDTMPSESVQTPFGPQVPFPNSAVPDVAKESGVVPPVFAAVPLAEGANTVVSIGSITGLPLPPPVLPPPLPLVLVPPLPPAPLVDGDDGPRGSPLAQAVSVMVARTTAVRWRCRMGFSFDA